MNERVDSRAKVYDILKGFSTAMMVTHSPSGTHGARPMHVAEVDEAAAEVLFLTGHGALAGEIQRDSAVLLTFQNENSAYLSVRGHARIEHDKARIREVWKEPYKVWFPKGPEDPEVNLIAVELRSAEYWDNRGMNRVQYLFEAAKAYMKGEKPALNDGDQHAKTTL